MKVTVPYNFIHMQPICGHRNFRPPKIFDPLATRLSGARISALHPGTCIVPCIMILCLEN